MSLADNAGHNAVNWFELIAVVSTGGLHLVLQSQGAIGISITVASGFWVAYMAWHVHRDRQAWSAWGFRTDNLVDAFKGPTLLFVLAGLAMGLYGALAGTLLWRWYMLLLFLLYPLWGLVQQFLVQALVVANLTKAFPRHGRVLARSIGAVLFGAVHYPYPLLMLATCGLGFVFIPWYLRDRNLWPLGLYHGWLGTLFYLWVLGRDPWLEVFG